MDPFLDPPFWVGHTIKSNKPLLDRLGKRLAKEDIFEDLDDENNMIAHIALRHL